MTDAPRPFSVRRILVAFHPSTASDLDSHLPVCLPLLGLVCVHRPSMRASQGTAFRQDGGLLPSEDQTRTRAGNRLCCGWCFGGAGLASS